MRHYLEYAPYGTLSNLLAKYKASNRYLPELFLWHLFNSLAKALVILEQGHPNRGNNFVVHFDIKPDNIFLGYEATKTRDPARTGGLDGEVLNYPSIKLADFGLALAQRESQVLSMQTIAGRGTRTYLSPVGQPDFIGP